MKQCALSRFLQFSVASGVFPHQISLMSLRKSLTSSSRKQIQKYPFKLIYVYLIEDPQKMVEFISNWYFWATNKIIYWKKMILFKFISMFIIHSNARYGVVLNHLMIISFKQSWTILVPCCWLTQIIITICVLLTF